MALAFGLLTPLLPFPSALACLVQVLSELRNSFAMRRLDAILTYRKRIRVETGCNPEAYDPQRESSVVSAIPVGVDDIVRRYLFLFT